MSPEQRSNLLAELTSLREAIADLHNHKEQTAYVFASLNVAGAVWAGSTMFPAIKLDTEPQMIPNLAFLYAGLLAGMIALHCMMRIQLVQRYHCFEFYRIYTRCIRRIITGEYTDDLVTVQNNSFIDKQFTEKQSLIANLVQANVFQALGVTKYNYPNYSIVDEEIEHVVRDNIARNHIPLIEKLPSSISIVAVMLVFCGLIKFGADASSYYSAQHYCRILSISHDSNMRCEIRRSPTNLPGNQEH